MCSCDCVDKSGCGSVFEYIFYYHVQYRTENVKCVYDIIGAGMQTCLYQMAVIFIPFTMVYFLRAVTGTELLSGRHS